MGKKICKVIDGFVLKKRYIYVIFLLIICILYFCSFNWFLTKGFSTEMIQNTNAIASIILSLFSVVGIVFTLLYAIRQYESEKRHRRISKAADLAKLYADELLEPIGEIISVLSSLEGKKDTKIDFGDIFKKIDLDKISDFNENELSDILSQTEIMYYKYCMNQRVISEKNSKSELLQHMINSTLNRIEYFCIYFNSDIAEDMTVYQSLHQSFFWVIQYTYIYISSQNINDADKFYTNIIKTYGRWRKIYQEQTKEIEIEKRKLQAAKEKYRRKISSKTESPNA